MMNEEVLGQCAKLAHYETPRKIALLEHDFSLEKGEMTPTQKVKRRVVDRNYKEVIDTIYAD
jgi:long-chain acyl-CoA synthetase